MSTEIQHYEQDTSLVQFRAPEQVLAEAKKAAEALVKVVSMKKKKVMFNNEQYLEFEDWQTVGNFYGMTAKTVSTTFVQFGDVHGWEATAVVVNRQGTVITQADAMCLNDEENWGMVAKYEWQDELDERGQKIWIKGSDGKSKPKGKKVKIGDVAKPLFQLRSMAQTRACARALRQVLAWVVVLAGYQPSVAEEMIEGQDSGESEQRKPVNMPQSTNGKQQEPKIETVIGKVVSVKDAKDGAKWVTVEGAGLMLVSEGKFAPEIIPGATVQASAVERKTKAGDKFWGVGTIGVVEASTAKAAEPAAEDIPDAEWSEPEVEQEATTKGTIGKKRAQRLHILRSTNEKATGLTEKKLYEILKSSLGIEHLSDINPGMEEHFEKICKGEIDWKQFLD